mgnify:CR=1 FL=1
MALVIEKTVVKGPAGSNLKNEVGEQLLQQFMDAGFVDMVRKNSMPWRELMAYYRCAMMEVETKFKVLNEQFSLLYDRNPIEAIKSRMKTMESIAEKMDRKGIVLNMAFAVSAAFVLGDHLAFTMMFDASFAPAMRVTSATFTPKRGLPSIAPCAKM